MRATGSEIVQLFSRPAELAAAVALGGVEHREVRPCERELEELEQERVPVRAWRRHPARERVEVLEPDSPDGEHLANGNAPTAMFLAVHVEQAPVRPLVGPTSLVQAAEHDVIAAADEFVDRVQFQPVV
jgi:hypothetical protein